LENQNLEKRNVVCSSSESKGHNLTIQEYEIDKRSSQIEGNKNMIQSLKHCVYENKMRIVALSDIGMWPR
jgi:hypothetical protein